MFLIFSFLADIGSYLLPGVHIVLVSNAAQICRTLGEVSDRDVSNSASPSALRGIPGCQWPSDIFEEPTIITAINPGDNWIPYGIFVENQTPRQSLEHFQVPLFSDVSFFLENENSGNSQIAATILAPPGVAIAQMRWTFAWASLWMTRCWQKASDWYSWQEPDLPYSFILIFQGPTNWVSYLLCEPFP